MLFGKDPNDVLGNTIARANIQQLAKAANMQLMRAGGDDKMTSFAPMVMGLGLAQRDVPIGRYRQHQWLQCHQYI